MIWITAVVASLLATQVHGAPGSITGGLLGSSGPSLERRMEEMAYGTLKRRQATTTPPSISSPTNMTQWDTDTLNACMATLSSLPAASNPSGMAVCYNLVQLDTNLGTFWADLRLFEVSTPSGNWGTIPPQQMLGGISFKGAKASKVDGKPVKSRDVQNQYMSKRQAKTPTLLRTYMIIGQIDEDQMIPPMTMYDFSRKYCCQFWFSC